MSAMMQPGLIIIVGQIADLQFQGSQPAASSHSCSHTAPDTSLLRHISYSDPNTRRRPDSRGLATIQDQPQPWEPRLPARSRRSLS
ncbi:hypothetical protein RSOLAG1IB_09809 [Rhizoctonia solani AG-1 IB]|uniref:Uncharacterized protein n=1 Tax=Thanatephorus cucumeris (strain AG1-IB / isolate 7/3/14) TaxID=1108050 RepID=A0A0B7FYC1_THACB|nr:hypothetical protein RSOLAG1IB_09809 [Rhizoctonia solani AG-1 IB]